MEKYFNSYSEAATYLVETVLTDGKKRIVQIEELKMNNDHIFYKLTIEPYQDNEYVWPGITMTPRTVPLGGDYSGVPQIWCSKKEPYGYDYTCNVTTKTNYGYNPYQE